MSHGETIGDTRSAGGEPGSLSARISRFFSPVRETEEPQETVEFTPEGVEGAPPPAEEAWAPRFATVWRGYERAQVDDYLASLEDELAAVRAEHLPEHAIQAEIDRLGSDTAAILRVAHEKADAIASRAQAQADLLMAEAQARAEATTRDAEARRSTLDADADMIWRERTRLIDDTRKLADCMLSVADDAVERFPPETNEPPDANRAAAEVEETANDAVPAPPPAGGPPPPPAGDPPLA